MAEEKKRTTKKEAPTVKEVAEDVATVPVKAVSLFVANLVSIGKTLKEAFEAEEKQKPRSK